MPCNTCSGLDVSHVLCVSARVSDCIVCLQKTETFLLQACSCCAITACTCCTFVKLTANENVLPAHLSMGPVSRQAATSIQVDTTAPLKRIDVEQSLYELKHFEFKLANPFPADCDFDITLSQRVEEPEAPPLDKKGRGGVRGSGKQGGAGKAAASAVYTSAPPAVRSMRRRSLSPATSASLGVVHACAMCCTEGAGRATCSLWDDRASLSVAGTHLSGRLWSQQGDRAAEAQR